MSDLMFYGVLRMPFDIAMSDQFSQFQFYDRAQEAADRVEAAEKRIAELEQTIKNKDWARRTLIEQRDIQKARIIELEAQIAAAAPQKG